MKLQILALLAIAAFTGLAYADACASQPGSYREVCGIQSFTDCGDAASFIAIAFILVSLSIALAYMYAKFRQDAAAEVWAKDEAFNLLISVLMFVGLIGAFSASCSFSESYAGKNPFDASVQYIDRLVQSNGVSVLSQLSQDSIANQLDATAFFFLSMAPFSGTGVAQYANLKARSANKEFLIDLYLPILASLEAQKYLLQAIQWIGASILLPFAFVMRLIPPTRDFGNTLIAVFFAMYIVVPLLYSMSGSTFEKIVASPRCEYAGCTVHNFFSLGIESGGRGNPGADGRSMENATLYKIGSTIPQAVFIPNIVLIVAITCAMAVSKALRAIAV